jgi:hypothetical protein
MVGGGLALPIGNTHKYETPSWGFQGGGGRNFSKTLGVLAQFDYDEFGLQGATLKNQSYIYDYGCPAGSVTAGTCGVSSLDGNNHVWSFTLDPTFTLPTDGSLGAYAVAGVGFYHKVTNFTEPGTGEPTGYGFSCITSNVARSPLPPRSNRPCSRLSSPVYQYPNTNSSRNGTVK